MDATKKVGCKFRTPLATNRCSNFATAWFINLVSSWGGASSIPCPEDGNPEVFHEFIQTLQSILGPLLTSTPTLI
jgi:hypothetical protein